MNRINTIFFLLLIIGVASGCESRGNASGSDGKSITRHSSLLRIYDRGEYSKVEIADPWDSKRQLGVYYLLDRNAAVPENLKDSARNIIRVPLSNALVYSNVHVSLLHELGALDAVGGVCDASFVTDSAARRLIGQGRIVDAGVNTAPNVERIMKMRPDAVVAAPMADVQGHGKLDNLGIPIVEAADYAEPTPLGRAEWMRFYGRLVGKANEADSLFNAVEKEYKKLAASTEKVNYRPTVIFDGIYGGNWFVPASGSVTSVLLRDAGAVNPFDSYGKESSARLAPEEVMFKGSDAKFWFVRYFSPKEFTLADWVGQYDIYRKFKAVDSHRVYGSNTSHSGIFDDAAFHPHWVLADMIRVLHPEIKGLPQGKHYYEQLQ